MEASPSIVCTPCSGTSIARTAATPSRILQSGAIHTHGNATKTSGTRGLSSGRNASLVKTQTRKKRRLKAAQASLRDQLELKVLQFARPRVVNCTTNLSCTPPAYDLWSGARVPA